MTLLPTAAIWLHHEIAQTSPTAIAETTSTVSHRNNRDPQNKDATPRSMSTTDSSFSKHLPLAFLAFVLPTMGCASTKMAPTPVSIQLNQTTATIAAGTTQQFSASVTGTTNTAVTWSVDSLGGGNASDGTISISGLYTAPNATGTHVVTATSVADATASASARVTVSGLVSLSPGTSTLLTGAQQQFQAKVAAQNNPTVTWSVDSVAGGNSSVGTISTSGLYTAPSTPGSHTIAASIGATAADSATAPATVFSFGISPGTAMLAESATQQFTATIQGLSNTSVTWSVDGVAGGNATNGTVNSSGLYTAPSQSGTHTVAATSAADTSTSVSASVTVTGAVAVSPPSVTLLTNATQQFSASALGISNPTFTWAVDGVTGGNSTVGTISTAGLYTAPPQAGNHTIAASAGSSAGDSGSVQVTVFSFGLSPGTTLLSPNATRQYTTVIQGISNTSVTWSVDGVAGGNSSVGTISTSGLYTAPNAIGLHIITATSAAYTSDIVSSRVTVVNVAQSAVLTYHNDDVRDGACLEEVTLTPSNVNSTQFGKLASYPVDGQIYGQPLYLPQLKMPSGTHDVVFVATQNNSVYAFDADATSGNTTTFWHVNFGAPVGAYDSEGPWPYVGILSTPVIDVTTNTMYLVAHVNGDNPEYRLHAIDVTTGADNVASVPVSGSYNGDSLNNGCYQRMGLALDPVTNWIYIPVGSCPHGWIFAYDKTSLAKKAIFEATNGAQGGGFWSSGGAAAIDDTSGDVYIMSGVDAGDQQWITGNTMVGYNDSFLRLNATNFTVMDYFAPDDNYVLAVNDVDLGSGGNILVPGSSAYLHITIGGGKDGNIFVVNGDSMGGFNDTANNNLETVRIGTQQYNNIFSTPAYWNGNVYFHCNQDVLRAFSWKPNATVGQQLSTASISAGSQVYGMHGATVSVSANGSTNGIVWDIDNSAYVSNNPGASGLAVLHAYDATNVANELYNSSQAGTRDQAGQALKFTVPTIANGRVYVPTATELDIYGELAQ